MSKPTLGPLQRFRNENCDSCAYHDACLSDKTIELRCLLAALLGAILEGAKGRNEKCLRP
jgi:hypothetical protein